MKNAIKILSMTYVEIDRLKVNLRLVATKLGLDFGDDTYINTLSAASLRISVPNFGDSLEIYVSDKDDFKEGYKEQGLNFYGRIMSIFYRYDDTTTIPFLREFLKIYPTFVVYNPDYSEGGQRIALY